MRETVLGCSRTVLKTISEMFLKYNKYIKYNILNACTVLRQLYLIQATSVDYNEVAGSFLTLGYFFPPNRWVEPVSD